MVRKMYNGVHWMFSKPAFIAGFVFLLYNLVYKSPKRLFSLHGFVKNELSTLSCFFRTKTLCYSGKLLLFPIYYNDNRQIFKDKYFIAAITSTVPSFIVFTAHRVGFIPKKVAIVFSTAINNCFLPGKIFCNPCFRYQLFATPTAIVFIQLAIFGKVQCIHSDTTSSIGCMLGGVLPLVISNL